MKNINIAAVMVVAAVSLAAGCKKGTDWDPQFNVPEGIYISGDATKFSVETTYGAFSQLDDARLYGISTWLDAEGTFELSMVSDDNQPVSYGGDLAGESDGVCVYSLRRGAAGMSAPKDGFYRVIYSQSVGKVTLIPYDFRMCSETSLTESGEKEIVFDAPVYDNVNHIVTWKSSTEPKTILSGDYMFRYTESGKQEVPLTASYDCTLSTCLTGKEASVKTNVLSDVNSELTSGSPVSLRLKKKGSYVLTVSYDVKNAVFYGSINGTEFIIPEPIGMPEKLYMSIDGGEWTPMAACGVAGNGVFWTLAYFADGQGAKWSVSGSDADSFCSGTTNDGFTVSGNQALPEKSGTRMVFVDLYNKIVSFEDPALFAMGDCFGGEDVELAKSGEKYSATTTADGNIRMYATCSYNDRDWDSMEFGISGTKLCYRGVGPELAPTPIAAGVPVEIDLEHGKALFRVSVSPDDIPFKGQVYMITDEYGNMNWGASEDVIALNKVWNDDSRWIYVRYFHKGARIRFSTEANPIFGRGEFIGLGTDAGYETEDGYIIVPEDGVYGICVNLGGRKVAVQPATIYTYGTASADTWGTKFDDPFVLAADGVTLTYTVPNTGRLRLNPVIDGFDFSSWQREYFVDLETMDIKQRLGGMDEPNANYTWQAGTVIDLDFRTLKAKIH